MAQKSKENRKRGTGKLATDKVANLFSGLVYDAESKSVMHHHDKALVSYASLKGLCLKKSYKYQPFEDSILLFLQELKEKDFQPSSQHPASLLSSLAALEGN